MLSQSKGGDTRLHVYEDLIWSKFWLGLPINFGSGGVCLRRDEPSGAGRPWVRGVGDDLLTFRLVLGRTQAQ